jgi:hypothetical protein
MSWCAVRHHLPLLLLDDLIGCRLVIRPAADHARPDRQLGGDFLAARWSVFSFADNGVSIHATATTRPVGSRG